MRGLSKSFFLISSIAILIGCGSDQGDAVSTQSSTMAIHRLTAGTDKNYVELLTLGSVPRQPEPVYQEIRLEKSVLVLMRDGVLLSTDIYSPAGIHEPLPVILVRTPYNKNFLRELTSYSHFFASQGYHVLVQDTRGRYESEGDYLVSSANRDDGYDAVEWASKQPWSTGRIGTFGCSYLGENQLQLAATLHPNHLAAIPQAAGGGYEGTDRPFGFLEGGVPGLAPTLGWFWETFPENLVKRKADMNDEDFRIYASLDHPESKVTPLNYTEALWYLPTIEIMDHYSGPQTEFRNFISRGPADPYWDTLNYVNHEDQFDVPALHVGSWYDGTSNESMEIFNLLRTNAVSARARNHQYIIMSPTVHCMSESQENWEDTVVGARSVGDISKDYYRIYLDWFDHWLKDIDNDITDMPKFQYYTMGANQWRNASGWPVEETVFTKYYLHSDGDANNPSGTGRLTLQQPATEETSDQFTYDPANPVPSVGGSLCCSSEDALPGAFDQSQSDIRSDVLVYTSEPLANDIEVTGPLNATLYVSSSAADTDFTVKLIDVYQDGSSFNIQDSILRARYRGGYDQQVFMKPDGIYQLNISFHSTSNVFLKGHRVRLQVSSSNFPRFVRNLNTGGNNYDETKWVVATNTIHHSVEHPSHILLPVVPGTGQGNDQAVDNE